MMVPPGTFASAAASTLRLVAPVRAVSPAPCSARCLAVVDVVEGELPAAPAIAAPVRPAAAVAATTATVRGGSFRGTGAFLRLRGMRCDEVRTDRWDRPPQGLRGR